MLSFPDLLFVGISHVALANIAQGETIPIRLFLGGFDLTPTFRDVNKKYSTRYYLSLVLIDEGKNLLALFFFFFFFPLHYSAEVIQSELN